MRIFSAKDVVVCELEGGAALLDLRASSYFSLNSTAALLWDRLVRGATLDQLIEAICDRFDIVPSACRADIEALIAQMADRNLIEFRANDAE